MAVNLKALFKDTAFYGGATVLSRFLNYILVPLYTYSLPAAEGGYGIISNIYAYVAVMQVILTFGMETSFFYFMNKKDENPRSVFSTALMVVSTLCAIFLAAIFSGLDPISTALGYASHPEYIAMMAITVSLDSIQSIFFAHLRKEGKKIKFGMLKCAFVILNVMLNVIAFLCFTPYEGNVFLINMICTALITFAFYKEMRMVQPCFDTRLIKQMLSYSWPILVLGIAGILNSSADKIIFPFLYTSADAAEQLAVYSGVVKIAAVIMLFNQSFRYAFEPIMFGKGVDKSNKEFYAQAMRFYIIFALLAFLAVMAFLDIIKYMIGSDYYSGLKVVPIMMAAEILMGVNLNLSTWYKLTNRTIWGAISTIAGCIVLLTINFLFIPEYGYMACAWACVGGCLTTTLVSYIAGQHYYPINYGLKAIAGYTAATGVLLAAMLLVKMPYTALDIIYRTALMLIFFALVFKVEHLGNSISQMPIIGKFLRKAK